MAAAALHEAPAGTGGGGGTAGTDPQRPYTLGTFQAKLNRFQELIREITYQDCEATPEERRQWITENLRFDQFCDKIRDLFGADLKGQDLKSLYRKISTNPDAKVDWTELFGYLQSGAEEEEVTVGEEVSVFMVSKRRRVGEAAGDRKRRDTVQQLTYIRSLDSYLAASQKGALSVWSSKLRLQSCVDINEPAWVTGCDYLPGLRRVAVATERNIVIWDNRGKGNSQNLFVIKPKERSPQCLTCIPPPARLSGQEVDTVLYGDDQGFLNVLALSANDLNFKNSTEERAARNPQHILIDHSKLGNKIVSRKIHGDCVLKVKYFPDLRCFASCSSSSHMSFVLEETERLFDNGEVRGFSIPKGVNCFDYCSRANVIATGGVDKIIRVWHPHIFSRPTGKLMGHLFTIIDIACNERDQHIISLSTARVFRVWDIHTLTCLQIFTDNEERPGEKRIYSMLFDNKNERLLTGSSVIDAWPLTRAVQDTMQVPHTHDRPVVQILCNRELNQMVSVCTESVIKVWELESGKLVYTIPEAHGTNVEVTAVALDQSGFRLITGALDGSLKVWDFGAGQAIKAKAGRGSEEDLSITGIVYQHFQDDDHVVVASGWTNKIRLLLDSSENNDLVLLKEFTDVYFWTREVTLTPAGSPSSARQSVSMASPAPLPDIGQANAQVTSIFRKDYLLTSHEVTCMTSVTSEVIATGCSNGNIIFWNVEKSSVDRILTLPAPELVSAKSRHRLRHSGERRVNGLQLLVHKVRRLDPAYIKKLTDQHRIAVDQAEKEEEEDDETQGSEVSRGRSRRSVVSLGQGPEGQLDEAGRRLLRDLSARLEGKTPGDSLPRVGGEGPPSQPGPAPGNEEGRTSADNEGVTEPGEKKTAHPDDPEREGREDAESKADDLTIDPDAKLIVDTFEPVLISIHQDAFIRFWDVETGEILREVSPLTRRQGVPVTALCHDADVNFLVTGDNKGYLTLWDCKSFLENPASTDTDALKQVVCWRAHLTKVVSLGYNDSLKAILSASTDGSVRVWWGQRGRFVGFFGQHRPFSFPANEEMSGKAILPYDITEGPLAPVKRKSATQKIRSVQKFEYPLIFDTHRWEPFRRSAYLAKRNQLMQPEDKKFFQALIKPKAYNSHLESFATAEKGSGAVFRALPVYRVQTPKRLKTPNVGRRLEREDEGSLYSSNFLGPAAQSQKNASKVGEPTQGTRKVAVWAGPGGKLPSLSTGANPYTATGFTPSPRLRR